MSEQTKKYPRHHITLSDGSLLSLSVNKNPIPDWEHIVEAFPKIVNTVTLGELVKRIDDINTDTVEYHNTIDEATDKFTGAGEEYYLYTDSCDRQQRVDVS